MTAVMESGESPPAPRARCHDLGMALADRDSIPLPSARSLLVNSLVAALIASALMILLHELVHLVTGLVFGHGGTLYPFGVLHHGDLTVTAEVVALLAGPAFSLVTGILLQRWTPLRQRGDLAHLVWVWFAFVSVQEGVTYLCLTPFGAGDTGMAAQLMGPPVVAQFALLGVGVGGMFANAWAFAPHMARFAGEDPVRRNAVTLFPWLWGMIASVLLALLYLVLSGAEMGAGEQIAILAAGTATFVFAPMAHLFSRWVREVGAEPLRLRAVPVIGLVVLAAMIAGNIALSTGLDVG